MANKFRFVKIDSCSMSKNDRFGINVKKFYGLVHVMDSLITENDGHGITLNTEGAYNSNTHQTEEEMN